jgi:hypothetical protein
MPRSACPLWRGRSAAGSTVPRLRGERKGDWPVATLKLTKNRASPCRPLPYNRDDSPAFPHRTMNRKRSLLRLVSTFATSDHVALGVTDTEVTVTCVVVVQMPRCPRCYPLPALGTARLAAVNDGLPPQAQPLVLVSVSASCSGHVTTLPRLLVAAWSHRPRRAPQHAWPAIPATPFRMTHVCACARGVYGRGCQGWQSSVFSLVRGGGRRWSHHAK